MISGRSGTGKTALAVHVGHRTAELFPDGRLFVDLRAADTAPLQPADALARLLRAMGAEPATLPSSVEELTGLYRTYTGHRRILLILDNAARRTYGRCCRRAPAPRCSSRAGADWWRWRVRPISI